MEIRSCKLIKVKILSILCNEFDLPTMFKDKFNLAYDLTLLKDIMNFLNLQSISHLSFVLSFYLRFSFPVHFTNRSSEYLILKIQSNFYYLIIY